MLRQLFDRDVLTRIRMESIEMPDLRLTNRQARRLWNLDQFLSQAGDASCVIASAARQFVPERVRARRVD